MKKLSDISKRNSRIHLTDKDLPGVKKHAVGSKHTFVVHAEMVKAHKNEGEYPDTMYMPGTGKVTKPTHTMTGEYKIHSVTSSNDKTKMPPRVKAKKVVTKGAKVARYAARSDNSNNETK